MPVNRQSVGSQTDHQPVHYFERQGDGIGGAIKNGFSPFLRIPPSLSPLCMNKACGAG
jgi:hypothetical protein